MGFLDILAAEAMGLNVEELSAKVGLPTSVVESVLAALGKHHTEPGDTVSATVEETGVPRDKVETLLSELGGEDALAKVAGLISGGGMHDLLGKK